MRPITKSQFKLGLACLQKLRHARDGVRSNRADNDLLRLLAEGGGAAEALQRAIEPPFWIGADGGASVADDSLAAIKSAVAGVKQDGVRRSLYEVTITCGDFLARLDLLRVGRDGLELVEIKSKSWKGPQNGQALADILTKNERKVLSPWVPYLQDLAFQAELLRRWLDEHAPEIGLSAALPIHPRLVLAKSSGVATADDFIGNFRTTYTYYRGKPRPEISYTGPRLASTDLIREVDAAPAVALMTHDAQADAFGFDGLGIGAAMDLLAEIVRTATWPDAEHSLGNPCRKCEFRVPADGESGVTRCWGGDVDQDPTNVLKLAWASNEQVRYSIDRAPGGPATATFTLLEASEVQPRQKRQWEHAGGGDFEITAAFSRERFACLGAPATGPLYFLDFETACFPIPYRAGGAVNELIPFQFEGHSLPDRAAPLERRRSLPGFLDLAYADPRRAILRALREQFGPAGPIYHWSPFESRVIKTIEASLREDARAEPGDDELIACCQTLRERLVDLCAIAKEHVYLPGTDGSYSIKRVLPVLWRIPELRCAFASGRAPEDPNGYDDPEDPYRSLPALPKDFLERLGPEALAALANGDDEEPAIANGGLAMVFYHYVKLFGGHDQEEIQQQFRQYCRLDSAAMVLAFGFLRQLGVLSGRSTPITTVRFQGA